MEVLYPDPKVFGVPKALQTLGPVSPYEVTEVVYPETGGILLYRKGLKFPTKGFPFPQAIRSINVAKRLLVVALRIGKEKKFFFTYFILFLSPFKNKLKFLNKLLKAYNEVVMPIVEPIAPQKQYLIECAGEVGFFIEIFLKELGLDTKEAGRFARVIGTVLNYDNAYHLRLIDICSETTKEKLAGNPNGEIKRLIKIFQAREKTAHVISNSGTLGMLIQIALRIKMVRGAFLKALVFVTWENLCYDEIWKYNALQKADYDFMGKTAIQRKIMFLKMHDFKPPERLNV